MGVRQALFPVLAFGATSLRLPASRRYGPRQAESSAFVAGSGGIPIPEPLSYRVRLLSSLQLMVAPPVCEPGKDTAANFFPRLHPVAPGQPPFLTARLPGATGLAS